MKKEKIIKLSPLIVLLVATAYLVITILTTDTALVSGILLDLYFLESWRLRQTFNEKYGYWMTAFLLMLATFSFAAFTPTIYFIRIGIIKIDPLGFFTTILFIIVHRKQIPNWILELRADE
jgi:hypothetical protein